MKTLNGKNYEVDVTETEAVVTGVTEVMAAPAAAPAPVAAAAPAPAAAPAAAAAPAQNAYQQPVGGMPVYKAAAVRKPNAGKKKMIIIISSVAALLFAVVAAVIVFTNIHKCELCEKTYFGSKHNISFLGVSKEACKDCYDEFYNELYSVW